MLNFNNISFELLDGFAKSKAITNTIFVIVVFAIIALSIAIYRRTECSDKSGLFCGTVLLDIFLICSLFMISSIISFLYCKVQVEVMQQNL